MPTTSRAAGAATERVRTISQYETLHLPRVVEAREGLLRHFYAEELAQRSPALLYLVDQQPLELF
jgi:hypothetical protein